MTMRKVLGERERIHRSICSSLRALVIAADRVHPWGGATSLVPAAITITLGRWCAGISPFTSRHMTFFTPSPGFPASQSHMIIFTTSHDVPHPAT
jgi:hypothetical protein